jgi:uncharacterized membrane protein YqgA involved in biofilm formation
VDGAFPGVGTVVNVVAVVLGSVVGITAGHRLPERVRSVVTDALGLVTLLVAALSAAEVTAPELAEAVGPGVPVLVVLGSLVLGGIAGAALRLEQRLQSLAGRLQRLVARRWPGEGDASGASGGGSARMRFIEGWLTTSLLFCVGPLTVLGSLSDGLGRGIDQLVLKSMLDLFASLAFAATFGIGVLFSAVSVAVVQGGLTALGWALGTVISTAAVSLLTAVGGVLLIGLALRLLRLREVPVADLLPALLVAPLLLAAVSSLR